MSFSTLLSIEHLAALIFGLAVAHTFSTRIFDNLAHRHPAHAGFWHLLAEVEVVFGFWAFVLMGVLALSQGPASAEHYLKGRDFTEALFVFAIMVIAASRPILEAVQGLIRLLARLTPLPASLSAYFLALAAVPLLGSFITEPAAMTLAALILRDGYFNQHLGRRLQYATLGVLFVNVSIGGALTPYAAPPVLMVAGQWGWDSAFMLSTFGYKAALAVFCNALLLTWLFRREIARKGRPLPPPAAAKRIPPLVTLVHLLFLAGVVLFAHTPQVFLGLFLLFLGFAEAYQRYQSRLILREGLLVAFFLAGLIALGGLQQWWLERALAGIDTTVLYFVATALTAITDNAALTYLGSLVPATSAEFKYALVAGALAGGGLTVIANAPNPAGLSILKRHFPDESISPLGLLCAALGPTLVALLAFGLLPSL